MDKKQLMSLKSLMRRFRFRKIIGTTRTSRVGSISSRKKAKLYEEFEKLDDEMSISKLVYSEQLHQGKNSI